MSVVVKTVKYIITVLTSRLMIIGIIMVLLFAVLIGRIYELTIIEGENLSETFTRSIERDLELVGERGNIYD